MTAVEPDLTELETEYEVGGNSDERGGRRKEAKLAVLIVDRQVICLMRKINLAYRSYHVSNVMYRSSVNRRLFTRLPAREHDEGDLVFVLAAAVAAGGPSPACGRRRAALGIKLSYVTSASLRLEAALATKCMIIHRTLFGPDPPSSGRRLYG